MIKTTVVGSFPKPDYLNIPDWFKPGGLGGKFNIKDYSNYYKNLPSEHEYKLIRSIKEIIEYHDNIGIDIVTDGEVRREHYINYFLRFLDGIDFENLSEISSRGNAYKHLAPTVRSKVKPIGFFLSNDFKVAQMFTKKDVKITIPGPMTIYDTICNKYYKDKYNLLDDLSTAISYEVYNLVLSGCKHIQIDEPLFARKPEETLEYGIKYIEKCFEKVDKNVVKYLHICCGYPDKLNETDYPKADKDSYLKIAESIDNSCIDVVSIEDAHCHNNLEELLPKFKKIGVMLGLISISNTRIETVEEIEGRINEALKYIDRSRLVVAPDCGLGMLPKNIIDKKLKNMVSAVKNINVLN